MKETLSSQAPLEYKIKLRRAMREKIVICICFVVYMAFTIYFIAIKQKEVKYIDLEIANLCFRSLKFIADIYMIILFVYLLKFIISVRKKGADGSLTL